MDTWRWLPSGRVWGTLGLAGLVISCGLVWLLVAQADECVRAPLLVADSEVVTCVGEGDEAEGAVAVSARGPARSPDSLPIVAVSGTDHAERAMVCVTATGRAGNTYDFDHGDHFQDCFVSVNIAGGDDSGPSAGGFAVALAGRGTARGLIAVSVFGDSNAPLVSVSGTGEAAGHPDHDRHIPPVVAVSGCRAEHARFDEPDDPSRDRGLLEGVQLASADPSRVRVLVDPEVVSDPDKPLWEWEHVDVETGPLGGSVQALTCGTGP